MIYFNHVRRIAGAVKTITLHLPPEEEQEIKQRAALQGQDVDAYVNQLILIEIKRSPCFRLRPPNRLRAVEASGMSDEEVDAIFEDVIQEVRAERH